MPFSTSAPIRFIRKYTFSSHLQYLIVQLEQLLCQLSETELDHYLSFFMSETFHDSSIFLLQLQQPLTIENNPPSSVFNLDWLSFWSLNQCDTAGTMCEYVLWTADWTRIKWCMKTSVLRNQHYTCYAVAAGTCSIFKTMILYIAFRQCTSNWIKWFI